VSEHWKHLTQQQRHGVSGVKKLKY